MGLISSIYYLLTSYTDGRERAVALFFKSLSEHSGQSQTRASLRHLLQRNIAVINLWTEYRYKGYRYLHKSQRKKLYANLQLIAADFDRFYVSHARPAETVAAHIRHLSPQATIDPQKAVYLQTFMDYFSPARGVYRYRASSSFGRLLRNPSHEKLVGDCNQIVSLYIYLYSRRYDVGDLQIRVLPGHVALHYGGVDIEATNGTFINYTAQEDSMLVPVEEIVSINLLDMTDSYLSTHEVAAKDVLQASRLAFILSHQRELVARNLTAAYGMLVSALMKQDKYGRALEFAKASHDTSITGVVGHNAAVYEMERHNYTAARRFAHYALEQDELIRACWQAEGVYHYQAKRYHDAIKAYEQIDDRTRIRQCYEALFFEEQAKLKPTMSPESLKDAAAIIARMHTYAKKSANKKLIEHADSLNKSRA
ncbi:MAG TPA: hypothetical protein VLF69_05330 [Candidatus Saccharimonadales bacterium]|nr:hypothetical protein [Candidatus Saccharimonadales bacterium]